MEPEAFFRAEVGLEVTARRMEAAARAIYPIVCNDPPFGWEAAPQEARDYCYRVRDAMLIAMAMEA